MDATTAVAAPNVLDTIQPWIQMGAAGVLAYILIWVTRNHRQERDEWRAESKEHRDAMFEMLTQVSDIIAKTSAVTEANTRELKSMCERMDRGFQGVEQALAIQQSLADIASRVGAERPASESRPGAATRPGR